MCTQRGRGREVEKDGDEGELACSRVSAVRLIEKALSMTVIEPLMRVSSACSEVGGGKWEVLSGKCEVGEVGSGQREMGKWEARGRRLPLTCAWHLDPRKRAKQNLSFMGILLTNNANTR